ncbi:relaxase domain-containing protein [Streptomyces sp. NPDC059894]|uniref:relaxase domain-containing protein n=1 Tax=unclassified Streptomyces TaxID=2593676 RepID=UPI003656E126
MGGPAAIRPTSGTCATPTLVVAAFRHFDNRDGFPLLHDHCLVLNRVQRLDDDGEPVVGPHVRCPFLLDGGPLLAQGVPSR